jgi:hypothetical protein
MVVSLLLFICGASAHEADLEFGQQWYERRADEANGLVADPRAIDRAIYFLHKALEHTTAGAETGVLLLKSYYFKGQFATQGKEQKRRVFGQGKALGEKLLERFPNSPGLRLFYAANLGKWAEHSGVLAAAESRIPDKIRENAEEIIRIAPDYDQGAGYYLLGAIHFRAPYIPFLLSWPDNRKAIANLKKALEMNADSLGTKLILAQALLRQNDREPAMALLEDVTRQTPKKSRLLEDRAYIQEAQALLNEQSPNRER